MVVRTATIFAILIAFLIVEDFTFGHYDFYDKIEERVSPNLLKDVTEEFRTNATFVMFNFMKSSSDVLVKFASVIVYPYYALVTLNDGYLTFTAIGPNIFIQERLVSSCKCRLNDGKQHTFIVIMNKHLGAYFYVDNVIVRRQMCELNREPSPESDRIANQTYEREILMYSDAKVEPEGASILLPPEFRYDDNHSSWVEIF